MTAKALARVVATRRKRGAEPLTFGMTFPFSTHNYQLRFWMAAGGVDPDEDVRLVVLPPPYMVDSLANGHVDAFCVGAPWNSVAVDLGIGHILHFVSDILVRAAEKVLAVRQGWSEKNPDVVAALIRAPWRAPPNSSRTARTWPRRRGSWRSRNVRRRCRGDPANPQRAPEDFARRHHPRERPLSPGRTGGRGAPEPGPGGLALCADGAMGANGDAPEALKTAMAVFRPDLYDAALGQPAPAEAPAAFGAFAGPAFDPDNIGGHLAAFEVGRWKA